MKKHTPRWNYRGLLQGLGTTNQILDIVRQAGFAPLPYKTVAGWRQRNAIPGKWAPLFINVALKRGLITGIDALVLPTPRQKLRQALERRAVFPVKPEWAEL